MNIRLKGKVKSTEIAGSLINTISIGLENGQNVVLDRDRTEYIVSDGIVDILWKDVYVRDGVRPDYDIDKDMLKNAKVCSFEIEETADDEYGFVLYPDLQVL